jgi:hypothetical protein
MLKGHCGTHFGGAGFRINAGRTAAAAGEPARTAVAAGSKLIGQTVLVYQSMVELQRESYPDWIWSIKRNAKSTCMFSRNAVGSNPTLTATLSV